MIWTWFWWKFIYLSKTSLSLKQMFDKNIKLWNKKSRLINNLFFAERPLLIEMIPVFWYTLRTSKYLIFLAIIFYLSFCKYYKIYSVNCSLKKNLSFKLSNFQFNHFFLNLKIKNLLILWSNFLALIQINFFFKMTIINRTLQ